MFQRNDPIGAELHDGGVHFRVWAPNCRRLSVVLNGEQHYDLTDEGQGYFSGLISSATTWTRYKFQLDRDELAPDPASHYQPEGPHGPSQVIDPAQFVWSDVNWKGLPLSELVIYELHIGTFTTEGTWRAAAKELKELADVGINCIEVMPVAEFPGSFGWGYDGVQLFAPTRIYGKPDDFRDFVNRAHGHGIAVILDVVYNHLGPDGNYLGKFAKSYFTDRYKTDWGAAINFDGEQSASVREFFLANVAYWIRDFHLDGLRLDATQNIYDKSPPSRHILTQISQTARAAAPNRIVILTAENEWQHPQLCRPVSKEGNGLDALWNDDYHHSAIVALTGNRQAYYSDYLGHPQEFISAAKYGYLYQGQWYSWQKRRRGLPAFDLSQHTFINFIQNHDQIANSGQGLRVHQQCSPSRYRVLMTLTILMPGTPMLFQGQEFCASSPFLFFADHNPELAAMVKNGRAKFLSQFPCLSDSQMIAQLAVPHDPKTFERCKLNFDERQTNRAAYQLTKDLISLRRSRPGFQPASPRDIDGAVIGSNAFVLRYFFPDGEDRLLIVNLGADLDLAVLPEPLLAPPEDRRWEILFSTEDLRYGGNGIRQWELAESGWLLTAECAIVLQGVNPTSRK